MVATEHWKIEKVWKIQKTLELLSFCQGEFKNLRQFAAWMRWHNLSHQKSISGLFLIKM